MQHEISRKTAAYTAKRLFKCCNYCSCFVCGRRFHAGIVAGKGCPKTISPMLDQGAWRIMGGMLNLNGTATFVGDQWFLIVGVLSVIENFGNKWPRGCITDVISLGLSTFASSVAYSRGGVWQKGRFWRHRTQPWVSWMRATLVLWGHIILT